MNSRDTLEKYFRDNLQEIQVAPEPEIWLSISSRINKKEKHRSVSYFWFEKFGNLAASYFVMFSLFHFETYNSIIDLQDKEVATTVTKPSSVSNNFNTVTQGHNALTNKVDKQYGDNEAEEGILFSQKTIQKRITTITKTVKEEKEETKNNASNSITQEKEITLATSSDIEEGRLKNFNQRIAASPIQLAQITNDINPLAIIAASEEKANDKKRKKNSSKY